MSKVPYKQLQIGGEVSVRRLDSTESVWGPNFLLFGPTGAGKSSFIEALANDREMGISKDQLESFTQTVTAYRPVNIRVTGFNICLLDCPGFSDTSLSDLEIIEMVNKWMKEKGVSYLMGILYFCPVTDTRLPRTRRKTMEMLQALVNPNKAVKGHEGAVTIVTTMWDQVWCERVAERAEKNYTQLKDGEMIEKGADITKFKKTQESALAIIDNAAYNIIRGCCVAYTQANFEGKNVPLMGTGHGAFLYGDLISRIEGARQRQLALQLDLQASLDDPALQLLFQKEQKHLEYLLEKYEPQLGQLERAPIWVPDASHKIEVIFRVSPPPPQQPSVVQSDDAVICIIPALPEFDILPQDPLPLTPPERLRIDMHPPQSDAAQAALESSPEPNHAPHASSAHILDDARRLPRRKPGDWMKVLLRRIKGMFPRTRRLDSLVFSSQC
ncbi:hypothetical protein CVT24_013296 [Panaeolus cyanescens]|uniref:G domain-containing protein n=1 Tax=Panaeolus cyanescens TaxID=181874 RepID=A0A409YNN8_9AGAR|nr:hypothetical protein CVT24_013296 [Panaeolus cyanescens]